MNVKKSPISASMVQLLVWKTRSLGLRHMIPIVIGMQPHWRMMGALETADGTILFGIRTAFILAVIRRTSRCARPRSMSGMVMSHPNESESFDFGFGRGARRRPLQIGADIFPPMS